MMWNLSNKIAAFGALSAVALRNGLPHVHHRQADALALLGAEPVVEQGHAGLGAIAASEPDRPPPIEVAHHDAVGVALADRDLVDADRPGGQRAGTHQLRPHVLLVGLLDRLPIEAQLLGDILDRRGASAPANEDGEPLSVKRIVGKELEPLPPHFAARLAKGASDLELKIDARVATRQIAYAPHCAVVPAPMQASAVGAPRFFERRFSLKMRALGSPKMPRTVPSGRKPGNAYPSHSRRFRLPAAAIEIPPRSEHTLTRSKPCSDAAFRCVNVYNSPTRLPEDPEFF
jgi:hypothetical protein